MLLDNLVREQEALEAAETTITETLAWLRERNERPMGEWSLTERYRTNETLLEYEAECDALAAARQETVQNKRMVVARTDSRLFNEYLYESLSVSHPVLADLATLGGLLREARWRVERALVWA
jgi:hypothetical protein